MYARAPDTRCLQWSAHFLLAGLVSKVAVPHPDRSPVEWSSRPQSNVPLQAVAVFVPERTAKCVRMDDSIRTGLKLPTRRRRAESNDSIGSREKCNTTP